VANSTGDLNIFTKTSIALALIVALASSAVAAPKNQNGENGLKITMPSTTPEGNRAGWFMAWPGSLVRRALRRSLLLFLHPACPKVAQSGPPS